MRTRLLSVLLVFLNCLPILAQTELKALAVQGAVYYYPVGERAQKLLWTEGMHLPHDHDLMLGQGAYLGLIAQNGALLEIRQAGHYQGNALRRRLSLSGAPVVSSSAYANLALARHQPGLSDAFRLYCILAGELVQETGKSSASPLLAPQLSDLLPLGNVRLQLNPSESRPAFLLRVEDAFGTVLLEQELPKDQHLELPVASWANKSELRLRLISTEESGGAEALHTLRLKNRNEQLAWETKATLLRTANTSALEKIVLAHELEQDHLYLRALEHYQAAIKQAPHVETYQRLQEDFLRRVGLWPRP